MTRWLRQQLSFITTGQPDHYHAPARPQLIQGTIPTHAHCLRAHATLPEQLGLPLAHRTNPGPYKLTPAESSTITTGCQSAHLHQEEQCATVPPRPPVTTCQRHGKNDPFGVANTTRGDTPLDPPGGRHGKADLPGGKHH